MLSDLLNLDRNFRISYKRASENPAFCNNLVAIVDQHLSSYAKFYNLDASEIISRNNDFVSQYLEHIEIFSSTLKYPHEITDSTNITSNDYISYDLSLMLSVITTLHRNQVICNLSKYLPKISGKILIIGIGAGLELKLLKTFCNNVDITAYDIKVSDFISKEFDSYNIVNSEFNGGRNDCYDYIIAVELLEHLISPYSFMQILYNSLKKSGKLITTTATNLPQFDHLYNFVNDDFMDNVNFSCVFREEILHDYQSFNISAKNDFYILEKD